MVVPRIILDTNVIVAAARSNRGASYKLLSLFRSGSYRLALSVPLVLEYEDVLIRQLEHLSASREQVHGFLDQICHAGEKYKISFLWRPLLPDPRDDHVLELAVASSSRYVVTYNKKDFVGLEHGPLEVYTPKLGARKVGETEVGLREGREVEVSGLQVNSLESDTLEARAMQVRTYILPTLNSSERQNCLTHRSLARDRHADLFWLVFL
jgi:predicted nucleic acid-binding protein